MKQINQSNSNSFISHKRFYLTLILALCQVHIYAQLRIVPIGSSHGGSQSDMEHGMGLRTQASLDLPFFDDFSTAKSGFPDSKYWQPGSGTYVNNTLVTAHPSVNVATFDGLNASGTPYNITNPLNQSFTDTLTSQPINLAGKTPADSVYLSFHWLGKGLGELPDSSDFFRLEFLNQSNQWITVWNQVGYALDTVFQQKFVAIRDAGFFHEGFQFRFRSYGRNSGPYDTWHLDYVYLNAGRSVRQPYIFDVAMRMPISPYLRKYSSMPLRQYNVSPASSIADSVRSDIVNNFNNFNILTSTFTITNKATGTEYFRNVQRSIYVESLKSKSIGVKPSVVPAGNVKDSIELILKYYVTTTDTIPNVSLKHNDTISSRVVLGDYFAFDDGSAEYGIQVNQKLGRAAVQFVLAKPDTIGGVRMAMIPFNKDVSGQGFNIQILSNKNNKPDQVIAQRAVSARYASSRNGFIDYAFAFPIAVPDTFYVGWIQINEQPLTIGFDRNSRLGSGYIYYNLGTEWVKEEGLGGSIMIRPYLGRQAREIITGTEPVSSRRSFFPNPSKGMIKWENISLDHIEIYSLTGVLIQTVKPAKNDRVADVNFLDDGFYIIRAYDGKRSFVQKMLILK
jgi:hypothetical protein